jgi:hypothetical protein
LSQLTDIEQNYPVEEITVNGIKIWPWLRTYLGSKLLFSELNLERNNKHNIIQLLSSLLYGKRPAKKINFLIFSAASQRKNVTETFTDRMDIIVSKTKNAHIFETPIPHHHPFKALPHKNISSKISLILREQILSKTIKVNINGKDIIEQIMSDYKIIIPYTTLCKRFIAQTRIMKNLISKNDIKAFFLITPYTNMGYVYAAKNTGIKVIELQHGVINNKHYAYNVKKSVNSDLYPDYLLTWGENIRESFTNSYYINNENIIPVGNYYIDLAFKNFNANKNLLIKLSKYKRVIGFTAQNIYETDTIPIIIEAALKQPDVAIIYIPRDKTISAYSEYNFTDNIIFIDELNFYNIIQHCDFHCTISSSCALEAPALGVSNIMYDYKGRAENYYGKILPKPYTKYFNNFESLIDFALDNEAMPRKKIMDDFSHLLKPCFEQNVKQFINQYLS